MKFNPKMILTILDKVLELTLLIISVGIGLVCLLFLAFPILLHVLPFYGDSFDETKWKNTKYSEFDMGCPRGGMYGSLKRNHLKVGTAKSDVITLLGEPSKDSDAKCISYNLGMCSGFLMDDDTLDICFDNNDNIISVEHVQH